MKIWIGVLSLAIAGVPAIALAGEAKGKPQTTCPWRFFPFRSGGSK